MTALIGPAGAVRDHLTVERALVEIAAWSGDEAGALARAVDALRKPIDHLRLCSDVSLEVIIDGLAAGASAASRTHDGEVRATYVAPVQEVGAMLDHAVATDRWSGGRPGALEALGAHIHQRPRCQPRARRTPWLPTSASCACATPSRAWRAGRAGRDSISVR